MNFGRLAVQSAVLVGLLSGCSANEQRTDGSGNGRIVSLANPLACDAHALPGTTTVRFTLRNEGSLEIMLNKWGTPWDTKASPFVVSSGDVRAHYGGLIAIRRGEPPAEAFVRLSPGESMAIDYDVGKSYLLVAGQRYEVALKDDELLARVGGNNQGIRVDCQHAVVTPEKVEEGVGESAQELHPYYAGCNTHQETVIRNSNVLASNAARAAEALTYSGSPLYKRWFGDWTSSRATTVHDHIARYNTLDWEVRCGGASCCDDGAIGCQTDGLEQRIYVCGTWYDNAEVELTTQSRFVTLIHEHTHLNSSGVAGAEDIRDLGQCGGDCYGYWNALSLASDVTCVGTGSTCKAVRNAENQAFFASDALFGAMAVATLL